MRDEHSTENARLVGHDGRVPSPHSDQVCAHGVGLVGMWCSGCIAELDEAEHEAGCKRYPTGWLCMASCAAGSANSRFRPAAPSEEADDFDTGCTDECPDGCMADHRGEE